MFIILSFFWKTLISLSGVCACVCMCTCGGRSVGCWSGIIRAFLGLSQGNQCSAKASPAFHVNVDAVIFLAQRFPECSWWRTQDSQDIRGHPCRKVSPGRALHVYLGNFYSTGLPLRTEFFRSVCAVWCLVRDMRAGPGSLLVCWWLVFNASLGG